MTGYIVVDRNRFDLAVDEIKIEMAAYGYWFIKINFLTEKLRLPIKMPKK